jgi:hypothetical protein
MRRGRKLEKETKKEAKTGNRTNHLPRVPISPSSRATVNCTQRRRQEPLPHYREIAKAAEPSPPTTSHHLCWTRASPIHIRTDEKGENERSKEIEKEEDERRSHGPRIKRKHEIKEEERRSRERPEKRKKEKIWKGPNYPCVPRRNSWVQGQNREARKEKKMKKTRSTQGAKPEMQ